MAGILLRPIPLTNPDLHGMLGKGRNTPSRYAKFDHGHGTNQERVMSQRMILASISCALLVAAGVVKLVLRDWQVGLLLVGFAMTLWSNVRLQERLRALAAAAK